MKYLLHSILLLMAVSFSLEDCGFSNGSFACKEVASNEILYRFYESKIPQNIENISIQITDVEWPIMKRFLGPLKDVYRLAILDLKINQCGIKNITLGTFSAFTNLTALDLSENRIERVSFIEYLPKGLKKLILRNNNIAKLGYVFNELNALTFVDLSSCKLEYISFSVFEHVESLDFLNISSNNILANNDANIKNIDFIDISYNPLKILRNVSFNYVNISYTELEEIVIDESVSITPSITNQGAKVFSIKSLDPTSKITHIVKLGYLDISSSSSSVISEFNRVNNIKVTKELDMSNITIPILTKSNIDLTNLIVSSINLKLNNCSITDISELYFANYKLKLLNLGYNNIKFLKNKVFLNASIYHLDLFHSNIEEIENDAFQGSEIHLLDLSRNKLTSVNFLNNINVKSINLSSNHLENIDSFDELKDLLLLDLSNNYLKSLSSDMFGKLKSIEELHLENNKLIHYEDLNSYHPTITFLYIGYTELTFHRQLNVMNYLEIKCIGTLGKNHFQGLYNLEELQFVDSDISSIEPDTLNGLFNLIYLDSKSLFKNAKVIKNYIFKDLNSLSSLVLADLSIEELEPKSLVGLRNIEYLYLSNNKITKLHPTTFNDLVSLIELTLNSNNISEIALGTFQNLTSLNLLDLESNHIEYLEIGVFSNLYYLETLHLSRNALTIIEPALLQHFRALKYFHFHHNALESIDYISLVEDHKNLTGVSFRGNSWDCKFLAKMEKYVYLNHKIDFDFGYIFNEPNVDGVACKV